MSTILKCDKLNKYYVTGKSNRYHALKDVAVSIEKGEFVSVMGPSGSGKSTFLYNISGMDRADSGSIFFSCKDIGTMKEEELASVRLSQMGFVFQQSNLLKNLNILDNIILTAYLNKKESRGSIRKKALLLMEKTGVLHIAEKDITEASGGELQRASICRALINDPPMLFADEPTGALNSQAAAEVMDILNKINQDGTTVLLVTHDAKVAARTERVLFMRDGMIASEIGLGKYAGPGKGKAGREAKLSGWLAGLGF